ncbi:tripartite tricarboxylate transporter TctB family protein [Devosia albogilva]|uniref:Tripartite tricarboxylate transporter TctB family protein n=1 Tax=Devosia albogilva TaxID=429726 RepID=A0ABW5QNY2_9HYPH
MRRKTGSGQKGIGVTHQALEQGTRTLVPPYARVEVIGGAVMIAIAALIWFGAISLAVGTLPSFGPGALPRVLALLLALGGAGVLVRGLTAPEAALERFDIVLQPTLIVAVAIVIFALFIRGGDFGLLTTPQLGLCVVGPVTVFIAGCAAPQVNLRELLILAFGLTALMLLVFPDLLRLSIPPFPVGVQQALQPLGRDTAVRIAYGLYGAIAAGLLLLFRTRGKDGA